MDAIRLLREKLLSELDTGKGCWTGYLSSSALSTAVAVYALSRVGHSEDKTLIDNGLRWLSKSQNDDGGWGDTPASPSNLSTTLLVASAFSLDIDDVYSREKSRYTDWLENHIGPVNPDNLVSAVLAHYGQDRTFSAPILTMCALAGLLGEDDSKVWRRVPQLPFELAVLPHGFFKSLNLSVVSYAVPALIAIGLVRHDKCPARNPVSRVLRDATRNRTLTVLAKKQPQNGGFLEATPLTGFVTMSLATVNLKDNPVLTKGVQFLTASVRADGSWPIDTNLSTWLTSLAINALALTPPASDTSFLDSMEAARIRNWLLHQQYRSIHPYTCAAPGGWGWTDLPGGVPDADDTAAALRALKRLGKPDLSLRTAVSEGIKWLIQLQNGDGGIPTFCRGWGRLPFDKSCPDITAHALLAMHEWVEEMDEYLQQVMLRSFERMIDYLLNGQTERGTWDPLWFGNQYTDGMINPVYGTARVIGYLRKCSYLPDKINEALTAGQDWLIAAQNDNGGWGGDRGAPSTLEETSVAISALSSCDEGIGQEAVSRGVEWVITQLVGENRGSNLPSSPIGLYFASLWYDEKLYPLIFSLEALSLYSLSQHRCRPSSIIPRAYDALPQDTAPGTEE